MKKIFVFAFCIQAAICQAQKVVDVDKSDGVSPSTFFSVGGEPYINTKFTRLVSGTPYFKDEWLKATSITNGATVYKPGIIKLDVLDGQVLFIDAAGKEMLATVPIKKITLADTVKGETFYFVHSSSMPAGLPFKKGWYLQLASGKAVLYQFFMKLMQENKPYGAATTEQAIVTRSEFYIFNSTSFLPVKKAKDVLTILTDKNPELEAYIRQKGIANSSDAAQLTGLVTYYNSLP